MNNAALKETIGLLSELIQNKCINPPGNEMRSILSIERFLKEHGVESQVFETAEGRGNLLARLKGTRGGKSLMFGPSHVDVVPVAKSEEWEVDPFGGVLKDGYIWGRGALDMLFIVVTQIQAFIQLKKENFQPRGDLLLFIVSDEEAGGKYGVDWMYENHPDLIKVDYAVSEAGGVTIAPDKIIFMIGEKGGAWKRVLFKGTPGHGSMPYGSNNALLKAAEAATRIQKYCDSGIPITTEYLGYLADGLGLGFIQRLMLTNKYLLPFSLKQMKKKSPSMARIIHGLSRMTMSPNILTGGVKINVIPAEAQLSVDIRTLPNQNEEYVVKHIRKALSTKLAQEAIIENPPAEEGGVSSFGNASEVESDFVTAMESAIKVEVPNATLVPFIMPAVSDLRFLRERGVQAYGFSLLDPDTPMDHFTKLAHGTNERISIKSLELSQKVFYNLAKTFLS